MPALLRSLLKTTLLAVAATGAAAQQPLKPSEVTEAAITEALAPEPAASGGLRTRGFAPGMRAQTGQPPSAAVLITFATNSAELTPESRTALDTVGRALNSGRLSPLSFRVEGHADPRGGSELNLELSKARAESVVAYLVKTHGIDRQRLRAVGKGAAELLNRGQPDAPENRRVTFVTVTN